MSDPTTPDIKYIHIQWQGPLSLADVLNLTNEQKDYGVYQIYMAHPLYGRSALTYVGRSARRSFGIRFKDHRSWIEANADGNKAEIYVGRLFDEMPPTSDKAWEELIIAAERLLIYAHAPASNSSGLNVEFDESYYNVHILNWGNYGQLQPEVSGARWSKRFWDKANFRTYKTPIEPAL